MRPRKPVTFGARPDPETRKARGNVPLALPVVTAAPSDPSDSLSGRRMIFGGTAKNRQALVRPEEVPLADGHAVVAQDVVGGGAMERQVGDDEADKVALAGEGDITGARGRITFPIGAVKKGHQLVHQVMPVDQGGKPAATTWKLIARGRTMSRLHITLTGNRTHQIRIHLAAIGYPVVGDKRYGVEMSDTPLEALVGAPAKYADAANLPPYQIAVHLAVIRIPHPESDQLMEFRAPIPRILIALMPGAWILDGSS